MTEPKKRTTAKIRATLVRLLETTPLDNITVTALCNEAGINRATFYYHYESARDVFAEVEKYIEAEFKTFLDKSAVLKDGVPDNSFYVSFFEFVARNADICRMILNSPHKTDDSFLSRAMDAGCSKVESMLTKVYPHCPTSRIKYYYLFVSHGFLGLMAHWLNNGMEESPAEIAAIGEDIAHSGVRFLEK